MRVESAQIAATTQHVAMQKTVKKESLELWVGDRRPGTEQRPAIRPHFDVLTLTPEAQASQPVSKKADVEEEELTPRDRLIADLLRDMIRAITGREPKLFSPRELADKIAQAQHAGDETNAAMQQVQQAQAAQSAPAQPPAAGFGLIYDSYESYHETESMSFSAQGVIKTQDGKEIQFSVDLNMSREFFTEHSESLRMGAAKKVDPLVINFGGNAAELGDTKFQFDLDSDGRTEQIAALKPGSGMLALDQNGDGKINNGGELFGAKTGDGFGELAKYDEDKNGFIDEGDSIYNKLRIWTNDGKGNQQLTALGAKGIGAIYLGHLTSPFTYKNAANTTQGDVASTGLFIRENGTAGTVQQIDYAV